MYNIRFAEQADTDLLGIYVYTYNAWNEEQAIRYTAGLKDALNKLTYNPSRIGTVDRSVVRPGYRSYRYQSHLVFYRIVSNDVEVVRILHKRMDITQQFLDET